MEDTMEPKLDLSRYSVFPEHRSGWKYAMSALIPLHLDQEKGGITVIDFMEKTFSWDIVPEIQEHSTKIVWYQDKIWEVPLKTMRLYGEDKSHTFLLPNEDVVHYNKQLCAWQKLDMTPDQFQALPVPGNTPLDKPWIGFWHNPQNMPLWFDYQHSPQSIMKRQYFLESLKQCKGIYVFSQYFKNWLVDHLPSECKVPVDVVYHPTDAKDIELWSFDKFVFNHKKSILMIGYWLRNMHALVELKCDKQTWQKCWLYGNSHAFEMFQKEGQEECGLEQDDVHKYVNEIQCLDHVSNEMYDQLLTSNVAFLNLYDSSCNNAIIECMVRHTPLLVNKIPPVIEYLGEDYPFYYTTLEEAGEKLKNVKLIEETHEYLKQRTDLKDKLTDQYFLNSIKTSSIYKSL